MAAMPDGVALLAAGLLQLVPLPGTARTVLTGSVREDSSGRPLPGVEVVLLGYGLRTTTDAAGRYVLGKLRVGYQVVLFRLVGYQPAWLRFRVGKQDTTRSATTLVGFNPQQLEPVEVVERSPPTGYDAFSERRGRGFGVFIDSTVIRKWEFLSLESLLRRHSRIDFKQVFIEDERRWESWAISRRNPTRDCCMQVIFDGVPIHHPGMPGRRPPDLKQWDPSTLEAVEVYQSSAETPVEFSGGSSGDCGTLVRWTRRS